MQLFGTRHKQLVGITFLIFIIGAFGMLTANYLHADKNILGILGYMMIIGAIGMIALTCGIVMLIGTASMIFPNSFKELEE